MAEQQAEQAGAQEPGREAAEQPAAENPRPAEQAAARLANSGRLGCAGWAVVRWNGEADGAVEVDGGAENVRPPRLPELKPPPMRASAGAATRASVAATASVAITARNPKRNMWFSWNGPPTPDLGGVRPAHKILRYIGMWRGRRKGCRTLSQATTDVCLAGLVRCTTADRQAVGPCDPG